MKKLIIAAITATVVIIVLAGCLMPVMEDATATSDTFKNDGYFYVEEYSGSDITYSASWVHTNPDVITINGEDVSLDYGSNVLTSILLGENFLVRWDPYNKALVAFYGTNPQLVATLADGIDLTMEYSDGVLTISNTASTPVTRSITTDDFYSIANEGDYVMKKSDVAAYMTSPDSLIYGAGRTGFNNSIICTTVSGTIDEVSVSIWRGDATASNIQINKTEVSGYEDLYKFDSVSFVATSTSDSTVSQTVTYSYVVVPAEVTAERSVHFTDSENAILGIVPVMLIIALLVAIVALVIRNREI